MGVYGVLPGIDSTAVSSYLNRQLQQTQQHTVATFTLLFNLHFIFGCTSGKTVVTCLSMSLFSVTDPILTVEKSSRTDYLYFANSNRLGLREVPGCRSTIFYNGF